MIIDLILDRKVASEYGDSDDYNPSAAIRYINAEEDIFKFNYGISDAMSRKDEIATKNALTHYVYDSVTADGGNPKDIIDYVNSVRWCEE